MAQDATTDLPGVLPGHVVTVTEIQTHQHHLHFHASTETSTGAPTPEDAPQYNSTFRKKALASAACSCGAQFETIPDAHVHLLDEAEAMGYTVNAKARAFYERNAADATPFEIK